MAHSSDLPPPPPKPHQQTRQRSSNSQCKSRRLGHFSEVPEHQRRDFIVGYYRLQTPCLAHFYTWHNETLNIWTHLMGMVFFLYRGWSRVISQLSEHGSLLAVSAPMYSILVWMLLGSTIQCMLTSTIFHYRQCTCRKEFECYLCLDQSGILSLIACSYAAGITMAFSCTPGLQMVYLIHTAANIIGMSSSLMFSALVDYRRYIFLTCGLSGVIPCLHWSLIASPVALEVLGLNIGLMCGFYIIGAYFYATLYPEKWRPGAFDLVGQSHQIWHVFVFLAAAVYLEGIFQAHDTVLNDSRFCS